jgi:D-3-phosphoglycerate dehydrogenase / 2-oxoglutarate reductase
MNILIADNLSTKAVRALESLGATVRFEPTLGSDDLPNAIGNADVLVVRSTKVTAATIDAGTDLSLIIRAGAGVNTIDLAHASERGIHVANCPGKNADAVAELTMGLIVAADRRIADQTADLRAGKWDKKGYAKAPGLKGRTLGIVGYGSIGRNVAKRAAAFGMPVVAWSRSLTPEGAESEGIGYCGSPAELVSVADVVSLHLAATPETKGLVNEEFLASMKEGAILVNTSRGEIVDRDALLAAIDNKGIRVALDVYQGEPAAGDTKFPDVELAGKIVGTHHVGASTDQASEAIADETVRIVAEFMGTGKPANPVNAQEKSEAPFGLVVRHFNCVGVLAGVLDALREEGVNVEEMENAVFSGGKAAVCSLKLDQRPTGGVMERINADPNIIQAALTN